MGFPFCILNIGGVANLTYWDSKRLIGFDTGPGNCLMDDYSLTTFNKNFDNNDDFASKGTPIQKEVIKFMQQKFFQITHPKSLERLSFINTYNELIKKKYSEYDIMATLAEFTIESIIAGINFLPKKIENVLITGGGHRNIHVTNRLRDKLKITFLNKKDLDIELDYVEAELIAYLSARSIYNLPFTFPSTTGVSKPSSGGNFYKFL